VTLVVFLVSRDGHLLALTVLWSFLDLSKRGDQLINAKEGQRVVRKI